MSEYDAEKRDYAVTVKRIKDAVCRYYDITPNEMMSHRRSLRICRPRQIAQALCAELTPLSLPAIGRMFDRDHTTVMHSITTVKRLEKIHEAFAYDMTMLREGLGRKVPWRAAEFA